MVDAPPASIASGSSPLMRGTPVDGYKKAIEQGIIPANAGNTQFILTR